MYLNISLELFNGMYMRYRFFFPATKISCWIHVDKHLVLVYGSQKWIEGIDSSGEQKTLRLWTSLLSLHCKNSAQSSDCCNCPLIFFCCRVMVKLSISFVQICKCLPQQHHPLKGKHIAFSIVPISLREKWKEVLFLVMLNKIMELIATGCCGGQKF